MDKRLCPCGNGMMELIRREKCVTFRGVEMDVACRAYVCPHCGLESGCVSDIREAQKAMAEAYRQQSGLLTGEEIRRLREERQLTCEALADILEVAPETLEGWEEGTVQSPEMDRRLRDALTAGHRR